MATHESFPIGEIGKMFCFHQQSDIYSFQNKWDSGLEKVCPASLYFRNPLYLFRILIDSNDVLINFFSMANANT
jgi:hypothetical protein